MSRVTRLLRVSVTALVLLALGIGPLQAGAASTPVATEASQPAVILTELQTNGGSAAQEFIELYNMTDADIDLADWKLQFYSSTAITNASPDWNKPASSIALLGTVPAHDYFVISATDYNPAEFPPDLTMSSRMADTGGGVQLVHATATAVTIHDRMMWKKPASGETLPAAVWPAPSARGSLQRVPTEEGLYLAADNVLADFVAADTLSVYDAWTAPVPVVPEPEIPSTDSPAGSGNGATPVDPATGTPTTGDSPVTTANEGLSSPIITELLPNPATPLKDETDEFIELYNPNDEPYQLKGYALQVGLTAVHDYTVTAETSIPARGYLALYSRDTKLTLTNTGSRAKLLAPDAIVLSESDKYAHAAENQSWILDNGTWQWSTASSPGALNILAAPIAATKTAKAAADKASVAKAAAAKKAATAKTTKAKAASAPKAKKAAKPKAAKKKKAKTAIAPIASIAQKPPRAPIHTGILVAVIGAAILYAAYEYRHDVSNQLRKLFRHRGFRQFART